MERVPTHAPDTGEPVTAEPPRWDELGGRAQLLAAAAERVAERIDKIEERLDGLAAALSNLEAL